MSGLSQKRRGATPYNNNIIKHHVGFGFINQRSD